ncbi:MAG: response regulator [Rhodobiaceae bacterium]|nr:response regulator [Rhodobiaceae bacterium]
MAAVLEARGQGARISPERPSGDVGATAPNNLSVLLVEDSLITLELLAHLLQKRGHEVKLASDGEQGLHMLLEHHFDVVLLDYHLPKKDGMQVLIEYRDMVEKVSGPKDRPIFIGMTSDVEGLLSHPDNCENFNRIFCKPLEPLSLFGAIETALDSSAPPKPVVLERRSSVRTSVYNGETRVVLKSGESHECVIENISRGYIAVTTPCKPPIDTEVKIGRTEARVTRHTENGFVAAWGEPGFAIS